MKVETGRDKGSAGRGSKPFGDPELDDGLPGYAKSFSLPVKRLDHPCREVNADPPGCQSGLMGAFSCQITGNIAPLVKQFIKLLSAYIFLFHCPLIFALK